jgi:thioredoxin-dependent peroxiredoxin
VRDEIEQYRKHEIQPFGVNPASVQSHAEYAAKLRLPFPLLSDPDLAISRAYGSLKPEGTSIARSVCLIDRTGEVLYAQVGAPGAEIVLEYVRRS